MDEHATTPSPSRKRMRPPPKPSPNRSPRHPDTLNPVQDPVAALRSDNAALRRSVSNLEITIDTLNERRAVLKAEYDEKIRKLEAQIKEMQARSGRDGARAPPGSGSGEEDQGKVIAQLERQLREERERVRELYARLAETMAENQGLRIALESLTFSDEEDGGGRGERGNGTRNDGEMAGGRGGYGSRDHGHEDWHDFR